MSKDKNSFSCQACQKIYQKWQGSCFACGEIGSIDEAASPFSRRYDKKKPVFLIQDVLIEKKHEKVLTGIAEFDRVLGGGLTPASVILLVGNPGIGKSTFLLHIVSSLSHHKKILYIATEEDEVQIKLRLLRLHNKTGDWFIVQETDFELILDTIATEDPEIVIIDSLQNINVGNDLLANQIQKIKTVTQRLVEDAKTKKYTLLLTGHVTKDGEIAGPKTVEHLVDTVLYFDADSQSNVRMLRSTKNRFGPIDEVGFFMMTETGIVECENPQEMFIESSETAIGAALTWIKEGSREFLIEIQTLLVPSKGHNPQRVVQGVEHKQFLLICAIIEKYLHIPLYEFDIFLKIRGNVKTKDTHIDMSIVASLLSSYFHKTIKRKIVFSGEMNLSGQITTKKNLPQRIPFKKYGIEGMIIGALGDGLREDISYSVIDSLLCMKKIFDAK
jgi:DNA repair protein RadA/Sms